MVGTSCDRALAPTLPGPVSLARGRRNPSTSSSRRTSANTSAISHSRLTGSTGTSARRRSDGIGMAQWVSPPGFHLFDDDSLYYEDARGQPCHSLDHQHTDLFTLAAASTVAAGCTFSQPSTTSDTWQASQESISDLCALGASFHSAEADHRGQYLTHSRTGNIDRYAD
jgi:hypothetical protein